MCGIFCSISSHKSIEPDEDIKDLLRARGPDSFMTHNLKVDSEILEHSGSKTVWLTFVSSVLALRGDSIQTQPLVDDLTGSVFCWNGEAWKRGDQILCGNDALYLFDLLLHEFKLSSKNSPDTILKVLTEIAGPYAFVFYYGPSNTLFFGRDRLGRRSLMFTELSNGSILLTSNSTYTGNSSCHEVTTDGVHVMEFGKQYSGVRLLPWSMPLVQINKTIQDNSEVPQTPSHTSIDQLYKQLRESLSLRVTDIPELSVREKSPTDASVAVLFSGGLDCTLLARIMHDLLSPDDSIDLLNVAFNSPRSAGTAMTEIEAYEACPDRITGRSSYAELVKTCPNRLFRFVCINIPYWETLEHRPQIIRLMQPHNTEMDLSIAMALYFAARGQGNISSLASSSTNTSSARYTTPARVLISGLGADELFAGYTRHSTAMSRGGFTALIAELELDFTRIGHRNLGRDDRVMSHWAREVRYPYLDESFVTWALQLPVWEKCGFRPSRSVEKHDTGNSRVTKMEELDPAKMLLRMLAWELGMKGVANERKRAIQFGARTAKMEVGKGRTKGTDLVT